MTEPAEIRVLIADDQAAVREGLAMLMDAVAGVIVVGQAEDGLVAAQLAGELDPDVILMDINMPRCDGIDATERIITDRPGTRIVMLTTYEDDVSIVRALRAGALGYLTKSATRADIERAVKAAAAGQAVLDAGVQQRLLASVGGAAAPPAEEPRSDDLTAREVDVLRLIAGGRSNHEIAKELFVSEATVKTHINRIFAKTGSRDRAQAIRYAYSHGYAEPGQPR